ncbi:TIGR00730 family Rossman fold protein [uncultured Bartonella sp.]|uniref:LOG family protein n=1 Tax=uncultured Bartonella sp. TaxID=104108 RepID=UPI0025EB32C5|nr:TIGR00730 family Rossman fold protein [uncultured Bartonella sp.]
MKKINSICVYCGSSSGNNPDYVQSANRLGQLLAQAGITLVYGGGTSGIMGTIARAVKSNGGKVVGIIPDFLIKKEARNKNDDLFDEFIVTETMHQRKQLMFDRSDAFLALPGGIGTLEEIVEIMTWAQLGRHTKPIAFANIDGFYNPMIALLDHMARQGFIHSDYRLKPLVIDDIEKIVTAISRNQESHPL